MFNTETQREHLTMLANHLDALPEDYLFFDMETFYHNPKLGILGSDRAEMLASASGCFEEGTMACALGHAPVAGVPVPENAVSWSDLCEMSLGIDVDSVAFTDVFGGHWFCDDNTAKGAAARIRKHLAS